MAQTTQPEDATGGGVRRGRPKGSVTAKGTDAADGKGREKLSERQRRILDVIKDGIQFRGYPPSIREICDAVGLNSTSSVSYHLKELERKGYLRREGNKPRAVDIRGLDPTDSTSKPGPKPASVLPKGMPEPSFVPVLGQIAAGSPILAEQHVDGHFPLPQELVGGGELFLLQVVGESMQDAGILNGDWVVVRSQQTAELGEFVAAMIDGEATVKEFHPSDGTVWLLPHNPLFEPIRGDEAQILGRVVAVLRKI
ncbi:transcriptional repressor LexA [Corynebacterium variabile]|uniref:transcriptional repressor LexA n=1 Tax=Corynebacterium variabile TaxID=1727 RepID=UPI001DC3A3E6|nr:transcriptional repressor LexA [Corynebacterium variabile]HJG46268.1 transcriptional repressor LexA [Corynebacterium variabile]